MAGKVLNKMMGMLGFEDDYEDELEEENYEDEVEDIEPLNINNRGKNTGKIVNIHTASTAKVVIIKPLNFDEVADICDNLKNRKIVLVNTTKLESRVAQRLLDFMGGASYALGGTLQEVEKGVYILSPSNIEVNNDLKTELTGKGMFNWSK